MKNEKKEIKKPEAETQGKSCYLPPVKSGNKCDICGVHVLQSARICWNCGDCISCN